MGLSPGLRSSSSPPFARRPVALHFRRSCWYKRRPRTDRGNAPDPDFPAWRAAPRARGGDLAGDVVVLRSTSDARAVGAGWTRTAGARGDELSSLTSAKEAAVAKAEVKTEAGKDRHRAPLAFQGCSTILDSRASQGGERTHPRRGTCRGGPKDGCVHTMRVGSVGYCVGGSCGSTSKGLRQREGCPCQTRSIASCRSKRSKGPQKLNRRSP